MDITRSPCYQYKSRRYNRTVEMTSYLSLPPYILYVTYRYKYGAFMHDAHGRHNYSLFKYSSRRNFPLFLLDIARSRCDRSINSHAYDPRCGMWNNKQLHVGTSSFLRNEKSPLCPSFLLSSFASRPSSRKKGGPHDRVLKNCCLLRLITSSKHRLSSTK